MLCPSIFIQRNYPCLSCVAFHQWTFCDIIFHQPNQFEVKISRAYKLFDQLDNDNDEITKG